jgi:hypothetical protein
MKFLIYIFFYSSFIWGQASNLKLEGSYKIASSMNQPISFTLTWSEDQDGRAKGTYRDNYYSQSGLVTGFTTEAGRNLAVMFPAPIKGVKSINLLTSRGDIRDISTTIPLSIITRDAHGTPLTTVSTRAQFSSGNYLVQNQQASCSEGMGNLEGFCGLYSGMVSEDADKNNKCDLTGSDMLNLELSEDGSLALLFGPGSEVIVQPRHEIGRLPSNPSTNSIDVLSRHCRNLERIKFPSDNCKRVHLSGAFVIERNRKHFKGTYSITDEKANQSCKYGLSLDLQAVEL